MEITRQLAAIMFADIAGFTAMMQENETNALHARKKLKDKLELEVSNHHGMVLEFKGDGAVCTFSSTLEAISAALAIQEEMQKDPVVPLRIGLHTGDILMGDGNIYGDGVNVASRIESFAIPGSILISGKAYDDIKNQENIYTRSLGKFQLKNVREEMEIYALSNPGIVIPEKENISGKGDKIHRNCILVLPFLNMSTGSGQDFFSDGLTEELISNLSRLKEMRVISRTTSMKYKGTSKDIKTIGSETGAGYIMEGSVRIQGNKLRITAQFVDATRDVHLWAENYQGTLDDIFDIQEKVSQKIVDALRIHLSGEEKNRLHKRYTENTEAYQLYLQGIFFWKKRNENGLRTAENFFKRAIKADPEYALAWAGLADTYSLMGEYTNISRRELYPKQMEAVNRALELDSHLAEAHISLAISLMLNEWNWSGAEKEFRIGLALNPNNATGHHWYGELLLFLGRTDLAFKEMSTAVSLDPVSQGILKDLGIHYYYTGNYDEAIKMALRTIELDPGFFPAYRLLSLCYTSKGLYDKALQENERWASLTGNRIKSDVAAAHILAVSGRQEEARKIIEQDNLEELLSGNDYRGVALVYTALGENDKAFEWLEKSYAHNEESLCSIMIDEKFETLRPDPRFKSLMKRIGLIN